MDVEPVPVAVGRPASLARQTCEWAVAALCWPTSEAVREVVSRAGGGRRRAAVCDELPRFAGPATVR